MIIDLSHFPDSNKFEAIIKSGTKVLLEKKRQFTLENDIQKQSQNFTHNRQKY